MAKSKIPAKKNKSPKSKKIKIKRKKPEAALIIIDKDAGLVFKTEKELFAFFQPQIDQLEAEYDRLHQANDVFNASDDDLENHLDLTLEQPSEIWHDDKTFQEFPIFIFIRPLEQDSGFHIAITYVSADDEPTFIFLHLLTKDQNLVSKYRRGDLIYDRTFDEVEFGSVEGDSLSEGDPLAIGLFIVMLKVRAENDIAFSKFKEIGGEFREETIESADEIWKSQDMNGATMVTFIKEFPDYDAKGLFYIAVTLEDPTSQVHTLLYSFPTNDESLVERYRQGENLQAEEIVQESSH